MSEMAVGCGHFVRNHEGLTMDQQYNEYHHLRNTIFLITIIGVLILVPAISRQSVSANTGEENIYDATMADQSSCRVGVGLQNQPADPDPTPWLRTVNAGWFVNFNAIGAPHPDAEYVRTVRISQDKTNDNSTNPYAYLSTFTTSPALNKLKNPARAYPGSVWLVGNEPDRQIKQDDTYPKVYAKAYHDVYYEIKAADPTALVGTAALVEITPGRLQYWEIVWEEYFKLYGTAMPVDVWNMHIYPLAEIDQNGNGDLADIALGTDKALAMRNPFGYPTSVCSDYSDNVTCMADHDNISVVANQVVAMRKWMKDHGYQQKPLIITEFGILFNFEIDNNNSCQPKDEYGACFDSNRVSSYLTNASHYFDTATNNDYGMPMDGNRLIQQYAWYGMYSVLEGHSSNLLVDQFENFSDGSTSALTSKGWAFKHAGENQAKHVNLAPKVKDYQIVMVTEETRAGIVHISAELFNNGSVSVSDTPVRVTFYENAAMTKEIGSTYINNDVYGCARQGYSASVAWHGVQADKAYKYWVKIDSDNRIAESNENDNVGSGTIYVTEPSLFIPIVDR